MTLPIDAALTPRRGLLGRRACVALAVAALALLTVRVGAAVAFWLATDSSNAARAAADSLQSGPQPTLTAFNGQDVAISWPATSTVGGYAAGGYAIARYPSPTGGTATAATGGCSGTIAGLSCTEYQVPAGTWYYAVTPRIHNWTGAQGARSDAVTVVAASLTFTANQILGTLPASLTGGTIAQFTANETVTFRLDSPSGTVLSASTSAVNGSGQASGFSVTIPAGMADGAHVVVAVGGGGSQATSNSFTIDTSPPSFGSPALTLAAVSNSFISGTTAFYNSSLASSFTVTAPTVADAQSGIQKVNFPTIGSGISGGGDDTTSPYSTGYSTSPSAPASGAQTVTATDNAGVVATTTFTVTPDGTAPAGGSLAVNSTGATGVGSSSYSTSGSFSGTRTDFTDSGSGLASSTLTRAAASLSLNTCDTFGPTTTVIGTPSETNVATGCYRYTLTGTDNVGNTTSLTTVVKVDTTAPAGTITAPATGATVSGSSVNVVSSSADGQSGVASAQFQVAPRLGSFANLGTADTTTPYQVSWNTSGGGFPDGSYDLKVVTTDNAGNIFTSAIVTVTVTNNGLTYAGTGPAVSRTSSGSLTVSYPPVTATNDLLLLVEANNANQNITTPTGWTLLADQTATSPAQYRFTVWWKNASAGETSVSLAVNTNASGAAAWVVRYTRPSPAPAALAGSVRQGQATGGATLTPGAVTTNQPNATVISIATVRAATTLSLITPQGFSFRNATTAAPSSVSDALGIADQFVPTSGTTPASPTWSQSGTPGQWAWMTAAFK